MCLQFAVPGEARPFGRLVEFAPLVFHLFGWGIAGPDAGVPEKVQRFGGDDIRLFVEAVRQGICMGPLIRLPRQQDTHRPLRVRVGQSVGGVKQKPVQNNAVFADAHIGVEGLQRLHRHVEPVGGLLPGQTAFPHQRQGVRQRAAIAQADRCAPDLIFRRFMAARPARTQDGPAAVRVLAQRVGDLLVGPHPQAVAAAGNGQRNGAVCLFFKGRHAAVSAAVARAGRQLESIGGFVVNTAKVFIGKSGGPAVFEGFRHKAEGILRLRGQNLPRPDAAARAAGRFKAAPGGKAGQIVGSPQRREVVGITPGLVGDPGAEAVDRCVGAAGLGQIVRLFHKRLHTARSHKPAVPELHRVGSRAPGQHRLARRSDREGQPKRFPRAAARKRKPLQLQAGEIGKRENIFGGGGAVCIDRRSVAGSRGRAGIAVIQRRRQRIGVLQAGFGVELLAAIARAGDRSHRFAISWAAVQNDRLGYFRRSGRG